LRYESGLGKTTRPYLKNEVKKGWRYGSSARVPEPVGGPEFKKRKKEIW
jgi:hypothetical protein